MTRSRDGGDELSRPTLTRGRDEAAHVLENARRRVAVDSAWGAGSVQSLVLGATSRTITQFPRPLGRS